MTSGAEDLDAHALLAPILRHGIGDVRAAAARVLASTTDEGRDDEAVHDFRVAIRRLRTALRPARDVYGKKKLRSIAAELGRVARASGSLRDEEVLRETIAGLTLEPQERMAADRWLAARKPLERARRRRLAELIGEPATKSEASSLPSLAAALNALEARLATSIDAPSALRFAAKSLTMAERGVTELIDVEAHDVVGLHELRIRFKRLRYTCELFGAFYGARGAALLKAATKMQKRLGEVHDFDEATNRVLRARSLSDHDRRTIVRALRVERANQVARAFAERATWKPTAA
jgi:CHAD domain-containing protein